MKNTTKWIGITLTLLFIVTSCNTDAKKNDVISLADKTTTTIAVEISDKTLLATNIISNTTIPKTDSATLLDQKCMICHTTAGKTDKTMLAPPFYQVKDRYIRASTDKASFVKIMSNWVKDPKKEKALMRGAMQHLDVMPKLGYADNDINTIVNYIYDNDMPKPDWLDAHQKEHKSGQGRKNGQGNGKGLGGGRGQGRRL